MPDDSSRRTSPRAFLSRSQTLPGALGLGSTHLSSQRPPICGSGLRDSRERYAPIRRLRARTAAVAATISEFFRDFTCPSRGKCVGCSLWGRSCIFPRREPGGCVGVCVWGGCKRCFHFGSGRVKLTAVLFPLPARFSWSQGNSQCSGTWNTSCVLNPETAAIALEMGARLPPWSWQGDSKQQ